MNFLGEITPLDIEVPASKPPSDTLPQLAPEYFPFSKHRTPTGSREKATDLGCITAVDRAPLSSGTAIADPP